VRERILIVKVNARVRRVPKAVHVVVPVNHHDQTNLEQGCHRDWPVVPCDNKRCIGVGNGGGVCWWYVVVAVVYGGGPTSDPYSVLRAHVQIVRKVLGLPGHPLV
jgi:hypothetical protein